MMYLVLVIEKDKTVTVDDAQELPIQLIWSEGMVGASPVFETREDAERYVGNNGFQIIEVEMDK